MKKAGILNPALAAAIARLGHTDTFVISDCGLPIPRTVPVIDLSLVAGIPRFTDVLDAVLAEVSTEGAVVAAEAQGGVAAEWIAARLQPVAYVPHEALKAMEAPMRKEAERFVTNVVSKMKDPPADMAVEPMMRQRMEALGQVYSVEQMNWRAARVVSARMAPERVKTLSMALRCRASSKLMDWPTWRCSESRSC